MLFNKEDRAEYKSYLNTEIAVVRGRVEKEEKPREQFYLNHYLNNLYKDLNSL